MQRWLALLLLVAACRTPPLSFDGGEPSADDMAVAQSDGGRPRDLSVVPFFDMHFPPTSCCGVPGNPGNEHGVGKACSIMSDCANQSATICASAFGAKFCTMVCKTGGPANQCGSGAVCQCAGTNCACIPAECAMPPPGC